MSSKIPKFITRDAENNQLTSSSAWLYIVHNPSFFKRRGKLVAKIGTVRKDAIFRFGD